MRFLADQLVVFRLPVEPATRRSDPRTVIPAEQLQLLEGFPYGISQHLPFLDIYTFQSIIASDLEETLYCRREGV